MILSSKGIPEQQVRWHLSPARIRAYLHAAQVMEGHELIWPSTRAAALRSQEYAWLKYERWKATRH